MLRDLERTQTQKIKRDWTFFCLHHVSTRGKHEHGGGLAALTYTHTICFNSSHWQCAYSQRRRSRMVSLSLVLFYRKISWHIHPFPATEPWVHGPWGCPFCNQSKTFSVSSPPFYSDVKQTPTVLNPVIQEIPTLISFLFFLTTNPILYPAIAQIYGQCDNNTMTWPCSITEQRTRFDSFGISPPLSPARFVFFLCLVAMAPCYQFIYAILISLVLI